MNESKKNQLFEKIQEFKQKYYQNQLIKGGIYVVATLMIFFLLFAIVEHFSSLNVFGRTLLFWTYIIINLIVFGKFIALPLLNLFEIGKTLDYKHAAKIIGKFFPEIDDKLLNLIELAEISEADNKLIAASIKQKINALSPFSFKKAIDFSVNQKHLKWVFFPVFIILFFVLAGKDYILTQSSARIIKHNTFFEPEAPFNYKILNSNLNCKQFDDFLLKIKVEGNEIPSEIFITWEQNTFKMNTLGDDMFDYSFTRVHSEINFRLIGAGYSSKNFSIKPLLQPKVVNMKITVDHPKHTGGKKEIIENNGDIFVPEGSLIHWDIELKNTNAAYFIINEKLVEQTNLDYINLKKQITEQTKYSIVCTNTNGLSDTINYFITTIKDEFPKISLTQSYDTSNNIYLFSGLIKDDYLLNKLEFIYSYYLLDSLVTTKEKIDIQKTSLEQFFHSANFEKLNIDPEKELKYHFKVWDNDGINGSKFTKSKTFTYKAVSIKDLIKKKNAGNEKTRYGLNKSLSLAEEIQKEIKFLNKKILDKKELSWEEKQKVKEILKKQKKLEEQIKNTQKKSSENLKTQEKINSSSLEKQKKIDELINSLINEEMKKLLREMQDIIEDVDKEKLTDLLEKLNNQNIDLEKELERELELLKQLEFEEKTEEILNSISKLRKQQSDLKNKTEEKGGAQELEKRQEELKNKMDEIEKKIQNLRDKNTTLENKNKIPKTEQIEENIKQNMQKSQEALQKRMKKKSSKSQQQAIDEMKQLEEKLKDMQKSCGLEKPIEDMQSLRKILENLIRLSFDQEDLMAEVKNTAKNSSEFVKIVQQQNKLSDNSKIIEDSLFALSKRVVQIQATVNKEISSIRLNMKKATGKLEARDINKATEKQQFVMTSSNNLALLLSEILEQMQKELEMPPSQCNKQKNCNKPNPNCNNPSLSELRKAQKNLNQKMKKGKKPGEQGEKQAQMLLKLSRQQEQIRNQLMKLRDEIGKNGEKGKIDKILNDMQENERDIINNKITQETINRQKDILTRLLDVEDSDREQGEDEKRESTEWNFSNDNKTQDFLKYEKMKRAQEELIKTTPIQLAPFYKTKVNNYFNRIIND